MNLYKKNGKRVTQSQQVNQKKVERKSITWINICKKSTGQKGSSSYLSKHNYELDGFVQHDGVLAHLFVALRRMAVADVLLYKNPFFFWTGKDKSGVLLLRTVDFSITFGTKVARASKSTAPALRVRR